MNSKLQLLLSKAQRVRRRLSVDIPVVDYNSFNVFLLWHLLYGLQYGDVCEFGVAQGRTSTLMAKMMKDTDRILWLFDSFKGLPAPTSEDTLVDDIFNLGDMQSYEGKMACPRSLVENNLREAKIDKGKVKIVEGWLEDSQHGELPDKIGFAYADVDFYDPTKIVLNILKDRLTGIAIVGDYGHFSSGVKQAVDEYADIFDIKTFPGIIDKCCLIQRKETDTINLSRLSKRHSGRSKG